MKQDDIERLADLVCEVDSAREPFPPEDRARISEAVEMLHRVAEAASLAHGYRVYIEDEDDQEARHAHAA